jgi:hypothetical protein
MKKRVYFIVILATLIFAGAVNAATFYVDTAGNDLADFGDVNRPWRTIVYALSNVSHGDIIKINDGVYNEGRLKVPEGVSLTSTSQNASKVTIQPNKNLGLWPFINLSSTRPGSNGNQTISYLSFNGDTGVYRGLVGIKVQNRNNVKITHCNISNFTSSAGACGVSVRSTEIGDTGNWWEYWPLDPQAPGVETNIEALWPTNPVENFELSYCNIINCGYAQLDVGQRYSAVELYHLKNSSIHHNTINTEVSQGQPIKGTCAFLDNVDIYNNDLTMAYYTGAGDSSYALEVWMLRRGCEIYNNTSNGLFSITVGKETKIHDNTIIATWANQYDRGIGIEFILQNEGEIYNNYVEKAGGYGIDVGLESESSSQNRIVRNIKIYNNIIYHPFYSAIAVVNRNVRSGHYTVENIEVYNNICDDMASPYTYTSLIIVKHRNDGAGSITTRNLTIKRNILVKASGCAGETLSGVENIAIDENLFWNNYKNSWSGSTPTNAIIEDPKFKATGDHSREYYELQPDSPMWDAFNNGEVAIEPPPNVRVVNN